jgi:hypothetical protein
MSSSGVDVMQKKSDDTPIIWREYEALNTMQVQVNYLQTSIQALTQSINALQLSVKQRPPPHADADDESAHGDNEDFAAAGRGNCRGNGHPVCGCIFVPLGAQRVPF